MIKLKNILAENMRRFKTKNLNEDEDKAYNAQQDAIRLNKIANHYLMEQETINFDKNYFTNKKQGQITFDDYGFPTDVDGVQITDYETQWQPNFTTKNFGGRGTKGGKYNWVYGETVSTGVNAPGQQKPGISIKDENEQEVGTFIF
jgi:hypothetical protein